MNTVLSGKGTSALIEFQGLGEVAVRVERQPVAIGGARQRRLLAMFLIHRNAVVSSDRLIDAVFGPDASEAAGTTLRSYVARIRRAIDGHDDRVGVVTRAPGYLLRAPDETVDVARFETAVGEAATALARGDAEAASAAAHSAIRRWTGDPYAEFDDEEWVQPEAQRLRELRLVAVDHYFESQLALGHAGQIMPEIERMTREHPLREGFRSQLIIALYRSGRQAEALRAFHDYRTFLSDELGLEPSPQLVELESKVLGHDASLTAVPAVRSLHGYRIGERLGSGSDGTLYSATVPGVDRQFALRSYRSEIADSPSFVRNFEAAAQRLASLRLPGVVPIHDYWRGPGEAYLVTARLQGRALHDRLGTAGRLGDRDLTLLVERIGGALASAESNGLTHGRIHESNVLYDEGGLPYLTDFALGADHAVEGCDVNDFAQMLSRCTTATAVRRYLDDLPRGSATTIGALVEEVSRLLEVPPGRPANPYKGLEAFDEADAVDFFGRGHLIDEIVKRLHDDDVRARLVLVVGGSGTGKSSAVRAGLLPRLRAGDAPDSSRWLISTFTPGGAPFERLAEALTRLAVGRAIDPETIDRPHGLHEAVRRLAGDSEVFVVVDQLEELFTSADPLVQSRFFGQLADAVTAQDSRLRVVATLRADFYDRPLATPSIAHFVNDATVAIPVMTAAELEAAIVEPARRVGRHVEGALVAELVSAVARDASALPALQFTLHELADRCDSDLTLSAYRELGGVAGAVAARAEQLYGNSSDPERRLIRQLFERMVMIGDGEPTRRRVTISDFGHGPDGSAIRPAIERWVGARLLTLDRDPRTRMPTVEVAHEALIREWPRLQTWIDEDRDAIATAGRLHAAAQSWRSSGGDESWLYRGVSLDAALELYEHCSIELSAEEREFVEASRLAAEQMAAEQGARLMREQRSNRRLRWQLAALGSLLVVASVIGWLAIDQRRNAEQARRFATAREWASTAMTNLTIDPERSTLLALAAIDATRSHGDGVAPEAITALHAAVVESRIVQRIPDVGGAVSWSPTGEYLVSEGPEDSGMIDLRDPATGESLATWRGDDVDLNDVVFSADGSMLATAGDDGSLRIWDADAHTLVMEHEVPDGGTVWGVSFSADGTRVAASWFDDGIVRVFDIASGQKVLETIVDWPIGSLNHDGSAFAVGNLDGGVVIIDVATSERIQTVGLDSDTPRITRFSPDSRLVAATGWDGIARIWDAATGELRFTLGEEGASQISLAWSNDGSMLAVGSDEGSAKVWDLGDGHSTLRATLTAYDTQSGVQGLSFSPDGNLLATGGVGIESMIVWDVAALSDTELMNIQAVVEPAVPLVVTTGDEVVVQTAAGISAFPIDGGKPRVVAPLPGVPMLRLAVDRGGTVLATSVFEDPGRVRLWDFRTGREIASFAVADFYEINGLAWSPDGEQLAVSGRADDSSSAVVVDRRGVQLAAFDEQDAEVELRSLTFSPDGTLLAIPRRPIRPGPADHRGIWIWEWSANRTVAMIDTASAFADWDPSGQRLVSIGELEAVGEVWDLAHLERLTSFSGSSAFNDVRFSPDGAQLATIGDDGDVNLWDAATGIPLVSMTAHAQMGMSLAYSSDGRRLASIDVEGVVRVWASDLDDLIATAERGLTRELTEMECRQYLHRTSC